MAAGRAACAPNILIRTAQGMQPLSWRLSVTGSDNGSKRWTRLDARFRRNYHFSVETSCSELDPVLWKMTDLSFRPGLTSTVRRRDGMIPGVARLRFLSAASLLLFCWALTNLSNEKATRTSSDLRAPVLTLRNLLSNLVTSMRRYCATSQHGARTIRVRRGW